MVLEQSFFGSRNRPRECDRGRCSGCELVEQASEGVDYVFHCAALRITHCADAPRGCRGIDWRYSQRSRICRAAWSKKIVAASSASVYGEPSYLPIDENHPFNNRTIYGAGKIAGEQLLRAYYTSSNLPYVAFRYFNVYGPRMDTVGVYTEVMIRWLDAVEQNRPPYLRGWGAVDGFRLRGRCGAGESAGIGK